MRCDEIMELRMSTRVRTNDLLVGYKHSTREEQLPEYRYSARNICSQWLIAKFSMTDAMMMLNSMIFLPVKVRG
jgi:hypothetical protein